MKKLTRIIFILLCVVVTAFALVACSSAAPEYEPADPSTFAISVESVTEKLEQFLSDGRENRTTYSDNERAAAEYLRDTLVGYGYTDGETVVETEDAPDGESDDDNDVETTGKGMIREFTTQEQVTAANGSTSTIERTSQNVVAVYAQGSLDENHKNVVIGAYYDNRYYSSPSGTVGTKSHGALSNGTGVAALLAIAEYLQVEKPPLDFSVTIVFFGASAANNVGVTKFYDQMTAEEKTGTVLMIELQRLGVDHVYAYSDSRETKRETFFEGVAEKNGLDIYKVTQKSPSIFGASALNGIPYYQWAMSGNFSVFFNHNIPTLNLVGANWETFGLNDNESADNDDIERTANDTLENLKKLYPDYGEKIATAATLVVESIKADDFIPTMEYDCENFPETDILLKDWIWYLVVLGVVLIAGAVMTFVNSHLAKKYPVVAPAPRKVKMAVFGMDYEDKKDDEIYVDIRPPQQQDEIFPGVPNNDGAVFGNPNDPFPTYPPMTETVEQKKEKPPVDNVSEVFDLEPQKEEQQIEPEASDVSEAEQKEAGQKEPEHKEETVAAPADAAETSEENKSERPAAKKQTTKKSSTTTSAPKPAPKKRTSMAKKPIKSEKTDAANENTDNE